MQDWWSNPFSGVYPRSFGNPYSYNHNWQNHPNFNWKNHSLFNELQGFHYHHPFVPPHQNTLEDTFPNFLQVSNQILQTNIKDDAVQTNTLEETLQAFMKEQAQINQELKDALNRIESYLKDEIENENFSDSMTQYGDNEIENPQMDDDDMFSDVEEDVDAHELKLVETLEQDHSDISCIYEPLGSCFVNSCDLNFCEDCTLGLGVNTWKPFELPPYELNSLPSNDTVQKDNSKSLPAARKHAQLKFKDDFPQVSSSKLDALQGGKSFDVLYDYKSMMGWNIADKKKMK
jgi:predicted lactoylglutathione lyase